METTYDYRVIGREHYGKIIYSIHKVHYKPDGKIYFYEKKPISFETLSLEPKKDLMKGLRKARKALRKPILIKTGRGLKEQE